MIFRRAVATAMADAVTESTVVNVDDNTKLEFSKSAISSVISEGKA